MTPMYVLPDFESAKSALSPEDYKRYLQSLALSDLTLEAVNTQIDRTVSIELDDLQYNIEKDIRLRQEDAKRPELLLDYYVKTSAKGKNFVEINITYCLQFETSEELPKEFFSIYGLMSADIQTWPFLRELVNSLTSLMGMPRLLLPILTDSASIQRRSVTA